MDFAYWWGPAFGTSWLFPLLCMIFMVAMMFMLFRRAGGCCMPGRQGRADAPKDARETPRQILDRRYAAGEITQQQYESMKRDIG